MVLWEQEEEHPCFLSTSRVHMARLTGLNSGWAPPRPDFLLCWLCHMAISIWLINISVLLNDLALPICILSWFVLSCLLNFATILVQLKEWIIWKVKPSDFLEVRLLSNYNYRQALVFNLEVIIMSKKGDQPGLVYMMYDPFFIDFLYYVVMTYFTQFSIFLHHTSIL